MKNANYRAKLSIKSGMPAKIAGSFARFNFSCFRNQPLETQKRAIAARGTASPSPKKLPPEMPQNIFPTEKNYFPN